MKFTESHEWVEVKGKVATVGITDYAKKELGEIVFIELPKVGETVKAGQEICVLESTKAAADVYAPISGKVVAVNEKALEGMSWLFKIEIANPKELESLLTLEQYRALTS